MNYLSYKFIPNQLNTRPNLSYIFLFILSNNYFLNQLPFQIKITSLLPYFVRPLFPKHYRTNLISSFMISTSTPLQ